MSLGPEYEAEEKEEKRKPLRKRKRGRESEVFREKRRGGMGRDMEDEEDIGGICRKGGRCMEKKTNDI